MAYFITGRNGFIGKNLVRYLIQKGERITDKLEEATHVIHLAAYGNHYNQTDPKETIQANLIMLCDLLERSNHVEKFYNISTSSVHLPVQTFYSLTKSLGEKIIDTKDDRFVNVRPYSVYGIGEAKHRLIPTIIRHLHTGEPMELDTKAVHDWIYVDDFIEQMLQGKTEVGSGIQYTNKDIADALEIISGRKLNYTNAKLRHYDTKNWKAPKRLNVRSIFTGLKQTYDYYRTNN